MIFDVEWLDAPGVKDRVLAATWARIRIAVGDQDLTELVHLGSESRRASVYGSAFPLAEWLVENWWHLLFEPSPSTPLKPGRGAPPWKQAWTQRHNLLAAREGTPLPDATFVRDGDEVVVRWFPDPGVGHGERVRFIGGAQRRIGADDFEASIGAFVDKVLQRLSEKVGEDEDAKRLADAWRAIQVSDDDESYLCRALATLGLDPYDPDEATSELEEELGHLRSEFPDRMLADLLEGADAPRLGASAAWLRSCRGEFVDGTAPHAYSTFPFSWTTSAHATGYALAQTVRAKLLGVGSVAPIDNLQELMSEVGWDTGALRRSADVDLLHGCVGLSKNSGKPILLAPGTRGSEAQRFLLARGLFFTSADALGTGRLLTRATTRQQRASRAFAAELLAPASALASEVSGRATESDVAALARRFGVSSLLIGHQLENHGIAAVSA